MIIKEQKEQKEMFIINTVCGSTFLKIIPGVKQGCNLISSAKSTMGTIFKIIIWGIIGIIGLVILYVLYKIFKKFSGTNQRPYYY